MKSSQSSKRLVGAIGIFYAGMATLYACVFDEGDDLKGKPAGRFSAWLQKSRAGRKFLSLTEKLEQTGREAARESIGIAREAVEDLAELGVNSLQAAEAALDAVEAEGTTAAEAKKAEDAGTAEAKTDPKAN